MLDEIMAMKKDVESKISEMTMLESLESERERASTRLQDLDNAIKALKENPQILQVLQLISKVRNRY